MGQPLLSVCWFVAFFLVFVGNTQRVILTAVGSVCIAVLIPSLMAVNRFILVVVPVDVDAVATADNGRPFSPSEGIIKDSTRLGRRLRLNRDVDVREIILCSF